jgi:subtilisin family serine protease
MNGPVNKYRTILGGPPYRSFTEQAFIENQARRAADRLNQHRTPRRRGIIRRYVLSVTDFIDRRIFRGYFFKMLRNRVFSYFLRHLRTVRMKSVAVTALYLGTAGLITATAEARTDPPIVKIHAQGIHVKADNTPLADLLLEVSHRTSTSINLTGGGDLVVTLDAGFSSVEELIGRVCENLAVVYEKQAEGDFRILRAEVYGIAHLNPSEPADPHVLSPPGKPPEALPGPMHGSGILEAPFHGSDIDLSTSAFRTPGRNPRDFPDQGRPSYRPGQLLIQFTRDVGPTEADTLHAEMKCEVLRVLPMARIHLVSLPEGSEMQEFIEGYKASGIVEKVGKNSLRYPLETIPNDPRFAEQWSLTTISAPDAWSLTTGSPDILVAVIDTGVDYTHPDLAPNIWINAAEFRGEPGVDDDGNGFVDDVYGWDFGDGNPNPMDRYSHGTQVAGIIAAAGNNAIGVSGVSWNTKILPLKVQPNDSEDMDATSIIGAIDYAIAAGARIVNCSFGGTDPDINPDGTTRDGTDNLEWDAFERLYNAGILAVCAAGNSGRDNDSTPLYPGSYDLDNIISVASATRSGNLSSTSNYGIKSVHLAAPGENILSTAPGTGLTEAGVEMEMEPNSVHYPAIGMWYAGTTVPEGITGRLYDCGYGYPAEFPTEVQGNIALIQRGTISDIGFYFHEKLSNAMAAGSVAAIIYNNREDSEDDDFDMSGGSLVYPSNWIPAVSVSMAEGLAMRKEAGSIVTVRNVTLDRESGYSSPSGTSFAAPQVSGAAALIFSIYPSLMDTQVRAAILDSVDPLQEKLASEGRLNAFNAILSIKTPPGDLTCDFEIGLDDAIAALQTIAGIAAPVCPTYPHLATAAGGNRLVGLSEALHALRELALIP